MLELKSLPTPCTFIQVQFAGTCRDQCQLKFWYFWESEGNAILALASLLESMWLPCA